LVSHCSSIFHNIFPCVFQKFITCYHRNQETFRITSDFITIVQGISTFFTKDETTKSSNLSFPIVDQPCQTRGKSKRRSKSHKSRHGFWRRTRRRRLSPVIVVSRWRGYYFLRFPMVAVAIQVIFFLYFGLWL
jgi:hypothetical protein